MDRKALLELAGKIIEMLPADITFNEVRQVTGIIQQMYPPTPNQPAQAAPPAPPAPLRR